jgi:hypothetical protein
MRLARYRHFRVEDVLVDFITLTGKVREKRCPFSDNVSGGAKARQPWTEVGSTRSSSQGSMIAAKIERPARNYEVQQATTTMCGTASETPISCFVVTGFGHTHLINGD